MNTVLTESDTEPRLKPRMAVSNWLQQSDETNIVCSLCVSDAGLMEKV